MNEIKKKNLIQLAFLVTCVLLALALMIPVYFAGKYHRECIEHGYPDVFYMVGQEPYCRNVLESVPLESLKVKP